MQVSEAEVDTCQNIPSSNNLHISFTTIEVPVDPNNEEIFSEARNFELEEAKTPDEKGVCMNMLISNRVLKG